MENLILDNISLILLLPLWIFLIIMAGRYFAVYVNKNIIGFLTILASFLGIGVCALALKNIQEPLEWIYPFIKINDFSIYCGLQIDKLSLTIAHLLFIISFAVQLFSISYMKDEKKYYKFFAFLNLFNFGMAFLLFSPNLFQLYVFWELIGVVSYLLIGFDYKNVMKSKASKRVFIMNRVGDTALISAIVLTSFYMYQYAQNKTFTCLFLQDFNAISTTLMAYTTEIGFYIICGLFVVATMVKSAQFPFYNWLLDAMEAKLPVSALLHSATLVASGVYLIIRLMPFLTLYDNLLKLMILIGFITAVICSILASIENNPKKVLAYSTSANLGLVFSALGLLNTKIALILLISHAFVKSMLFILLPKDEINLSRINFVLFWVCSLTLSGILFSGLAGKEMFFASLQSFKYISVLFLFITFITAFYISRLAFLLYKKYKLTNTANLIEFISYIILLVSNFLIYFILRGEYHIKEPFVAGIGGICLAILLYKNNYLEKIAATPRILENIYNKVIPNIYAKISYLMSKIDNKVFANYKLFLSISKTLVRIFEWIEKNIMLESVTFISELSKSISCKDMILQSGNIQAYNAYAFIILTVITMLVVTSFWMMTQIF